MIQYTNIQRYDRLAFGDYLRLPGYSHSSLKNTINGIKKHFDITDNVRVGALVDKILTEPESANMSDPLYLPCRELAASIQSLYGNILKHLESQVSYTAEIVYQSLSLPVTGRLDYLLPSHAVVDLKVTFSRDIDSLIDFMGYANQGWHYTRLAGVNDFYLMICMAKRLNNQIVPVDIIIRKVDVSDELNTFWVNNIIDYGKIIS